MEHTYLSTPRGDLYSLTRVGGCKAINTGLLIFGNGAEEILEFSVAPEDVALEWRDALHDLLRGHRPGRHFQQLDWLGLAAAVNPAWATEMGWSAPAEVPAGPAEATSVSARGPQRRPATPPAL